MMFISMVVALIAQSGPKGAICRQRMGVPNQWDNVLSKSKKSTTTLTKILQLRKKCKKNKKGALLSLKRESDRRPVGRAHS